uniref:Uncharacterized protein n=1 Tax=Arundo donax TaxID=35708 RepID=A0A0A9ARR5_ARUDO
MAGCLLRNRRARGRAKAILACLLPDRRARPRAFLSIPLVWWVRRRT